MTSTLTSAMLALTKAEALDVVVVEVGKKGGERSGAPICGGRAGIGGAAEKDGDAVSSARMAVSEATLSQGGGAMLARPWRFSRRASQRGRSAV